MNMTFDEWLESWKKGSLKYQGGGALKNAWETAFAAGKHAGAEEEREACAKVCIDRLMHAEKAGDDSGADAAGDCAAAIRARSEAES